MNFMSIHVNSFYGKAQKKQVILPPENPLLSDADLSDDEDVPSMVLDPDNDLEDDYGNGLVNEVDEIPETDNGFDSEDDLPLSTFVQNNQEPTGVGVFQYRSSRWEKMDFPLVDEDDVSRQEDFEVEENTPLSYFNRIFSKSLISLITEQTNLYSVQCSGSSINTNDKEIEQFIGILVIMGVVNFPSYVDYWSQHLRYPKIADVMSLKRFQNLRRYIHFADNYEHQNSGDRLFKIRPVLNSIRDNCRSLPSEHNHSIDEMMVPYKGTRAGNLRQYIQNKPHKWGYKIFVRAGVSGIIYDFIPYTGKGMATKLNEVEKTFGIGGQVVIYLCKTIPQPLQARVFFDNFFCSFKLIVYLKKTYGINSLGTLRKNRLMDCPFKSDRDLQKEGRGSMDYWYDHNNNITALKWVDNKVVNLASTFVGVEPIGCVKRWNSVEKRKVDVPCPKIVQEYNKHMGGVDLAGMLIELYRVPLKSKRWYLRLFGYMIDLSVVNAWLLFRRETKDEKLCLKYFRLMIADALLTKGKIKRGRPSLEKVPAKRKAVIPLPVEDSRYDETGHWPIYSAKGRCRQCKTGYSTVRCAKCDLILCFVPKRNCFVSFHKK